MIIVTVSPQIRSQRRALTVCKKRSIGIFRSVQLLPRQNVTRKWMLFIPAKNVLSCIQAKLDSIKAKLNEKHLDGVADSINKFNTRKSVDERNNNSDYEEPCKRPKINLGSSSPIYSVRRPHSWLKGISSKIKSSSLARLVQLNADNFSTKSANTIEKFAKKYEIPAWTKKEEETNHERK